MEVGKRRRDVSGGDAQRIDEPGSLGATVHLLFGRKTHKIIGLRQLLRGQRGRLLLIVLGSTETTPEMQLCLHRDIPTSLSLSSFIVTDPTVTRERDQVLHCNNAKDHVPSQQYEQISGSLLAWQNSAKKRDLCTYFSSSRRANLIITHVSSLTSRHVPSFHEPRYLRCSSVKVSIAIPIAVSCS